VTGSDSSLSRQRSNLLEMANLQVVPLLALRELGEHGFRIDVAHELADILPLPDAALRETAAGAGHAAQRQVVRQVRA